VDQDNRVERRPVQIGRQIGNMRVIISGLTADDTYILKGLQFIFPGMEVSPQFAGVEQPESPEPQEESR